MKPTIFKLAGLLCSVILVLNCQAQTPQAFNYQAIVRNTVGNPVEDSNITMRATIHSGSATGAIQYQETQAVKTNQFGLINIQIGNGTVVTGTFSNIPWQTGTQWIQIEANFGSGYVTMGASQLLSVPYALSGGTPLPSGLIVMWSGLISNIPAGWLLCDGTKSTPNLTDKFIYGVSSALENPGVTGGDSVHAFQVPMTTIISGAASTSQLGWNNGSSDMDNKEGATWYYPQTGGSYSTLSSPNNYYGTAPTTTGIGNTMPPYYKLAFIIKQ